MFDPEWRETTAYLPRSPIMVAKKRHYLILKLNFQKVDSIFFYILITYLGSVMEFIGVDVF